MTTQHTKEHWTLGAKSNDGTITIFSHDEKENHAYPMAVLYGHIKPSDKAKMLATPELLESLKELLNATMDEHFDSQAHEEADCVWCKANDLINKIED